MATGRCIAGKHVDLAKRGGGVLVIVPCGAPVDKRNGRRGARFCHRHEQAYREILLGILGDGDGNGK